ncbi:MAG: tRNA lysidine(34) synthetase TilS [Pyrinomonadaceae bacterium]|nr:tRNA lysidine(34) synthetase TilS [Pyrinomonadaceae bacterium]
MMETSQTKSLSRFARNLLFEWRKLSLQLVGQNIVVAVSGGADSCAMLLALHELKQSRKLSSNLIAAHFNHGLRGAASDADADFVRDLATTLGLRFVGGIQNPKAKIQNAKGNLEQKARRARYDFLREIAQNNDAFAVLTAHTLNDQAETFLLNLIRGSGTDGLSAMKTVRELKFETPRVETSNANSKIYLIRPLLSWARRGATENYCHENKIEFRHDAMNDDTNFARVRVRRQLLPLLESFNPRIVESLSQTATILRQDAAELNRNAENLLKVFVTNGDKLDVSTFGTVTPAMRIGILRLWLKSIRGNLRRIELKHLKALERLAVESENNKRSELPKGEAVWRNNNLLHFVPSNS